MKTVLPVIRVLLVTLVFRRVYCQDGYSEQDILRYQQMAANEGQVETITGYSTNLGQRDVNNQGYNSASIQYHVTDDLSKSDDYSRHDRSRNRKVYRIKNPFQQNEENEKLQDPPQDIETGASNQYAAIQYSLPPEQFLAQLKAEGQYQQQQQFSTQAPTSSYTATPQPQYQYSTISVSNYDNGQQPNYNTRAESRTYAPTYNGNSNNLQYNNNANSYSQESVASTPVPTYLSSALPNTQYLGTPANTYLSSPATVFLTSPQNLQQYVSSPVSYDYNNNRVTTQQAESASYNNNELNKRMHIDHYDNSANGVRFPNNLQNQYQNDYPSSTILPTVSPYYEAKHNSWQNNVDYNSISKTIQDNQAQYNNLRYNVNQQDNKHDSNIDSANSDTHRIGSMPAANNLFFNYVKPDYQVLNNFKNRPKNSEQEAVSTELYSHGDYGWKLSDKRSAFGPEGTTSVNNIRYQLHSLQPEAGVFSQLNFQMDSGKEYSYDQTPKPSSEKLDAEEFAKAAAKAHENYKQQLKASTYATNSQYNNNFFANNPYGSSYYTNTNKQRPAYDESSVQNIHSNSQSDLMTASPYYFTNTRENNLDNKQKLPFDHDKALKNIVPIDVSNVVQHSDGQLRVNSGLDSINKILNYGKEQNDVTQMSTPNDGLFYKDKNSFFSLNFKPKPEDYEVDKIKQLESILPYFGKQQNGDLIYNNGGFAGSKRYIDDSNQRNANTNQQSIYNQDSVLSSANIQQQSIHRPSPQSELQGYLKFNDIPHRITEAFTADSLRLHNNNFDQDGIPTPLPLRLNQNVDNHHLDVTSEILNKLIASKNSNINRPDIDNQGNALSTINGFKVANPYNVDLKLVADMLKGKSIMDEQFNKPSLPLKLDVSHLQQMLHLKNDNALSLSSAMSALTSPYFDIYNGGRYPYQGVKYSRSEEEAENIPIADASNNLAIGAVIDEEDTINIPEETNITENQEDNTASAHDEDESPRPVHDKVISSGKKRLNGLYRNRHVHNRHNRKYPKNDMNEPYPLLKPPPPASRQRSNYGKMEKNRRRVNKPKILRVFKTEPLFEANSFDAEEFNSRTHHEDSSGFAESKSDIIAEEGGT